MAFFSPLTLAEWIALEVAAYDAQSAIPANTGPGSTMGAIANAGGMSSMQLQQQLLYLVAIARLATIPPLSNGQPSPDTISFAAPFGITPVGSLAATGTFVFATSSPVGSQLVIPVGGIAQTAGGLQYIVVADPTQSAYSAALGGYVIAVGQTQCNVTMTCATPGSIGNLAASISLTPYTGAGVQPIVGISSISNPSALTNGVDGESDADFKARFTLTVSSGRSGTANAIIAAVLDIAPGIIYSFGDRVNLDTTTHTGFFTFIVNYANTGSGAPTALITAATAAINSIFGRAAGISFACDGPTMTTVNAACTVTPLPGFSGSDVIAAVQAAFATFVNGIGLNPDTTPTLCSIARCYAALLGATINGVPCVYDVTLLQLNGGGTDLTAAFGNQFAAGTVTVSTLPPP